MLALSLATLALAACGGSSSSSSSSSPAAAPFKVGLAGPFTGDYATYGASHKAGADIAMAELNAAGGVNGGQVSTELGDDLGDPKQAVLVAQKFIDDSSIVVVDGHMFSGATIAAAPKYQAAGLPMISPSATNPDITSLGSYIWRICMTDAVQGKGLANYSVTTLGKKNIAVMYDNSDYGRGLADAYDVGRPGRRRHHRRQGAVRDRRHRLQGPAHQDQGGQSRPAVPLRLLSRGREDRPAGPRARHDRSDARL